MSEYTLSEVVISYDEGEGDERRRGYAEVRVEGGQSVAGVYVEGLDEFITLHLDRAELAELISALAQAMSLVS